MCIIYLIDLKGELAIMKYHLPKLLTIFNTYGLDCYFFENIIIILIKGSYAPMPKTKL